MIQKLISSVYLKNGRLIKGFNDNTIISSTPEIFCSNLNANGSDAILIFDLSNDDESYDESLITIGRIRKLVECEIICAANINCLEDISKLLSAGCDKAVLNLSKQNNVDLIEEAGKQFGKENIYSCARTVKDISNNIDKLREYTSVSITIEQFNTGLISDLPFILFLSENTIENELLTIDKDLTYGISGEFINNRSNDLFTLKEELYSKLNIIKYESPYKWSDFKLNSDNHLTVVVQDIKTNEVLMVAYMNEEAYSETIRTGIMTYYSRSRNELWKKGDTSGHYQYVKVLTADCDMDTLVAKVVQIGNACHTGAYSCFFNKIIDIM